MAQCDCAAVRVHARIVVGDAEHAQHRQTLRRKRLVQLDHVELVDRHPELAQQFLRGRCGPDAHHARRDAGRRHSDDPCAAAQAVLVRCLCIGEQQRARTVVDARCVAGRHRTVRAHDAFQLRERFERRFARMLVARDDQRIAFLLRNRDRDDFLGERAVLLRTRSLLLAAQREQILIGAADVVVDRDVLGRLRHRIDAIQLFHQRIDEAPADRRIVDVGLARECARGLAHHERRACHALDAARDHQARLPGLDRARSSADRIHPGAAQAVQRRAGHVGRQPREQRGHARDVAVVLTGLVRAAVDHVVDR